LVKTCRNCSAENRSGHLQPYHERFSQTCLWQSRQ